MLSFIAAKYPNAGLLFSHYTGAVSNKFCFVFFMFNGGKPKQEQQSGVIGKQSLALDRTSALITWPIHPQPQASEQKERGLTSGAEKKQQAFTLRM